MKKYYNISMKVVLWILLEKENLSIIDTIQIDDSKNSNFLSNTGQGYIVCEK